MDRYTGDITAYRCDDGRVRLAVTPGPLRVTRQVLDEADPAVVSRDGDVVTFHSVEDDGTRRSYRYRITGGEDGPERGWLLCEPAEEVPDVGA